MAAPETDRLLATAVGHHQAGRLPEAEGLYRRILAADPAHALALQFLGVLVHQRGQNDLAIELIGQAIALNGQVPDFHYNIAAVFQGVGRLDEAAAHYSKAIALKPDTAEAHYELANVLARQQRLADAAAQYQRALMLRGNFPAALINLGNVLRQQNKLDEAVARWRQALALQPNNAMARMNIGLALKQQGKLDEAVVQLRQVTSLKPDYAEAYFNLGNALIEQGNIAAAFDVAKRGLAAKETPETRSLLGMCLCSPLVQPSMGDIRALLVRALSESWVRPADLAPAGLRFLALNDAIRDGMAHAAAAWPKLLPAAELAGHSGLTAFCEDALLRALLASAPVCDVALERFATALRFTLLTAARAGAIYAAAEPVMSLYSAVARQCFINNYAFAQSDAEIEWTRELRDTLAAAIASGTEIPALSLMAAAAYGPLHALPGAGDLIDRPWPDAVTALLEQQVRAPLEEQAARQSMAILTPIEDDVSLQVRSQYEENPYPQWVTAPAAGKPETVDSYIRNKFPHAPFDELSTNAGVAILVAGCGTGQHPIATAQTFKSAHVLAIDLSLTSLCYAQRKTRALGISNIEYAQADIMKLPSIGRTFDVIESSGVLHHLSDPFAGWRALLSMLRPGGIMKLGLYSEMARRDVVVARAFIADRGYRPTAEDIRRCRQELFDSAAGTALNNVTLSGDFFSTSGCRDLLFHVQEHRLTVPEIAAFLAANDLRFIGFELEPQHRRNYARAYPGDIAMTDLAHWHHYETENPGTFLSMYQFWVQKKRLKPACP